MLAINGLVAAGWAVWLFTFLHRWQDRVLIVGFLACGAAVLFLVRCMRRRRDWLTWAVFAVTVTILGVMTAINSYSTRFHLVTGAIMFISGAMAAAVASIREYRVRLAASPADIPKQL